MLISSLQVWIDGLDSALASVPKDFLVAAFFLPVVLASFSRRSVVVLGSVLTAGTAVLVILKPSSAALILAIGAYVGSLLVAVYGIHARRKDATAQAEFIKLRSDMKTLISANEQHFLVELKRKDKTLEDEKRLR